MRGQSVSILSGTHFINIEFRFCWQAVDIDLRFSSTYLGWVNFEIYDLPTTCTTILPKNKN